MHNLIYVLLYVLSITGFFSVAILTFLRQKSTLYKSFAVFALLTGFWQTFQFVAQLLYQYNAAHFLLHLSSLAAGAMAGSFFVFTEYYAKRKPRIPYALVAFAYVGVASFLSSGIESAFIGRQGIAIQRVDFFYATSLVVIGVFFMFGIINLLRHYLSNKDKKSRNQDLLLLIGVFLAGIIMFAFGISSSASATSQIFVPVGSLVGITIIGYAIIFHKLFDIHFFVLRAAAYLLSVGLITLFFLAPAIWLVSQIVNIHISTKDLVVLVVLSTMLSIAYRYIRKVFDNLTNSIFFRNYYDTQEVLDHLSDVLVRTIDLVKLEEESKKIILGAIHTNSLQYWFKTSHEPKVFAALSHIFSGGSHEGNIIIMDEALVEPETAQMLREKDISVIVRLRTTHGELGYITLGFKESGETYTMQDKHLLSSAADEIAISMQNALHFDEIQNFNKTLQERVLQATRELRQSNEKLKALDETKDEFITMASHQLRTPLTAVKGYLSMVIEGDAGKLNANQKKLLTQSFISSQRMVYLIADLLNLSRLNTGKFVIEPTPLNLANVVQLEVDQLKETAASRGITLNYEQPAQFSSVMLDENKIHQVVMNFIDNAIYYTPSGGEINVSVLETPSRIEYLVKDNGIGVPKHEQHRLFSKFYRADNAKKARPDGTGLGLFMAKKVIVAQGGAIIFESEEGKGSTFGFRFSKHQLHNQSPKLENTTVAKS